MEGFLLVQVSGWNVKWPILPPVSLYHFKSCRWEKPLLCGNSHVPCPVYLWTQQLLFPPISSTLSSVKQVIKSIKQVDYFFYRMPNVK